MTYGILAGLTWALETIILGIALGMSPFVSTEQAVFLAPFVSTFIHDFCSALWAMLYNGVRGNLKNVWKAFCKKIDTKTDDFNAVLRTIKKFLTEPYKAAVADIKYTKIWLANNNSWIQGGNDND